MYQPDMFPAHSIDVVLDGSADIEATIRSQTRLVSVLQALVALQQQTIQRLESELAESKCTHY